jgi:predicted phosphoribosyltransferase
MRLKDRQDAAQRLSTKLRQEGVQFDVVVALPRGGVVLGAKIAADFKKPFDLIIPRKIGAPLNEEYAIGAVAEDGTAVWNEGERAAQDPKWLDEAITKERAEAKRRREAYLGNRQRVPLLGRRVLIVDDGVATGLTMRLAIKVARREGASSVSVAIPVSPPDSVQVLKKEADEVVVLSTPSLFGSIGAFYETFGQVSDGEVIDMMKQV